MRTPERAASPGKTRKARTVGAVQASTNFINYGGTVHRTDWWRRQRANVDALPRHDPHSVRIAAEGSTIRGAFFQTGWTVMEESPSGSSVRFLADFGLGERVAAVAFARRYCAEHSNFELEGEG